MSKLNRQHGAVVIMTAGFMMLAVLFLALVVDTGRLYMEKRNLQRVADLAAIETASRYGCEEIEREGVVKKWRQEFAQASAGRNNFSGTVTAECGDVIGANIRTFTPNEVDGQAVRIIVRKAVPASLVVGGMFTEPVDLQAIAVATRGGNPLAALSIQSTTATINTEQSALLNAVVGGLLGGNVSFSALGWNGLIGTKVNLLGYIDALATELNLDVGGYDEVLSTGLTVGQLANLSAIALQRADQNFASGTTADLAASLAGLNALALSIDPTTISLGDLLNLQTGTDAAGAALNMNLFEIIQGSIMLAAGDSVANVSLPVNLFGLASASIKVKVVEPPQLSAIGNPNEIDPMLGADDPNAIFVRTAQVRALISIDLQGVLGVTNQLLGAVSGALSPLVSFLNTNISGLGLLTGLGNLLNDLVGFILTACNNNCPSKNVIYADAGYLQIGLDVGGARAFVTDHSCGSSKELRARSETEVGRLYVGKINEADLFSSIKNPIVEVSPAPLIELGYKRARPRSCFTILGLIGGCDDLQWEQPNNTWLTETAGNNAKANAKRYVIAGLGVTANSPIGNTQLNPIYDNPPNIGMAPSYQKMSSENIVGSLSNTLGGLQIRAYHNSTGTLGGLLNLSFGLLNGLIDTLGGVINTLSGLLDPLVNALLRLLGVNLAEADLGANLTCSSEDAVRLVH